MKIKDRNIKSIELLNIGNGYSKEYRGSYARYRVILCDQGGFSLDIDDMFSSEELKALPYWSARSQAMAMSCFGTSQLFEAQLKLGSFIGMKRMQFDPTTEESELWGSYCRRVTDFIKEL